ncbi:AraC family transcriptional regulator [Leptospira langatensis]|uniref:AraC family transcriptional regulator n=1 Tax=Leptospira langatensis TaxID=2484983 RepID=A0A5F1ZWP6_9LEPT|nr:helix-turn-helix domain-containing protein [Leptospira langatensis]TGK01279.1 AraC family transcriptional regulator [Leptospira langatensis]TGL42268.1 AraC family transcriptional regulator [Leptospira langatensis]
MYAFLVFGSGLAFLLGLADLLSFYGKRSQKEREVRSGSEVQSILSKPERLTVPTLFFCVSIVQMHLYLELSEQISDFPWFAEAHIPILFLIGPLTYLYFQKLTGAKTTRLGGSHFLPAIFAFLVLLPFFVRSTEEKLRFLQNEGTSDPYSLIILLLLALATILNLAYPGALFRTVWRWRSKAEEEQRKSFSPILALFSATLFVLLLFVIAQIFYMPLFLVAASGLTVIISCIFLIRASNPDLMDSFRKNSREARYQESRISGLDVEALLLRLEELMREKKLYLDEDLSLGNLSQELGLSTHQLSEILNSRLQIGFREYIAGFRLEEAARILREEPQRSVLSAAYAAGFKSKSAFHKLFQEKYGTSPTSFRSSPTK